MYPTVTDIRWRRASYWGSLGGGVRHMVTAESRRYMNYPLGRAVCGVQGEAQPDMGFLPVCARCARSLGVARDWEVRPIVRDERLVGLWSEGRISKSSFRGSCIDPAREHGVPLGSLWSARVQWATGRIVEGEFRHDPEGEPLTMVLFDDNAVAMSAEGGTWLRASIGRPVRTVSVDPAIL